MEAISNTCMCTRCKREVPFRHASVNHLEHLGLTICTLGLWLPFWILSARAKSRICDICGTDLPSD